MKREILIKGLELKIRDCDSNENEVDWNRRKGILISKNDAIEIVKKLNLADVKRSALWWNDLSTSEKLREFYNNKEHLKSENAHDISDEDIERLYRWHYA